MITKGDLETIAAVLRTTRSYMEHNANAACVLTVDELTRNLSDALARNNPRFNRQRFISASHCTSPLGSFPPVEVNHVDQQ